MQILGEEEDFGPRVSFKRNGSSLSLLPLDNLSRKSFSYNKLPQEPLHLSVLKLDGTSFDIAVVKTATVAGLKQAVMAAFSHLPKTGPGKVSWSHLWAQFCLCYDGQKLLTDSDCIGSYGIKEGDQLYFIRHTSINYNLIKSRSEKEDPELHRPRMPMTRSDSFEDRQKNGRVNNHCTEQEKFQHVYSEDDDDEDNCVTISCHYRLAHLLSELFSYCRLTSSKMSFKEKSSSNSTKLSGAFFGGSRKLASSRKYLTVENYWKGE